MKRLILLCCIALLFLAGCSTDPPTTNEKLALDDQAPTSLVIMKRQDPGLDDLLKNAYAYAVFPSVGRGGLIAGGSYGRGVVYQNGATIGYADFSQATIGGQIGGQTFSELVVIEDQFAMDRFKSGKLTFETNVSAVALDRGTAQRAKYRNGVIVFAYSQGGLMAEAVVGGQQFTFIPTRPATTGPTVIAPTVITPTPMESVR